MNLDTDWFGAMLMSVPFLTIGICGCGLAIVSGWCGRRTITLRAAAAARCDQQGTHQIFKKLTDPDLWDEHKHGNILFIDGDHLLSAVTLTAICVAIGGAAGSLACEFVRDPPGPVLVGVLILPAVLIMFGMMWFAGIKLFKPRPPEFVITTNPLEPIDDDKDVELSWVFIGDQSEFQSIERVSFAIVRSKGDILRKAPTKDWAIDMGAEDKALKHGSTTIHLAKVTKTGFFNLKQTDECRIDLKVGWKKRGEPSRESSFTLAATPSA